MNNISVQEASALMSELFAGAYCPQLTDEYITGVLRQPNYRMFSEVRDGQIVAMASLYTMNLLSRRLAVIEEVVTLGDYRRQGMGSSLVNQAIQEAEHHADCIELTVRADRPETIAFYEMMGFRDRNQVAMRKCVAR